MEVQWSDDFDRQLSRLEDAAERSTRDRRILELLAYMLDNLRQLRQEPAVESAMFKRVRQSGHHLVWRQSHPFEPGIALRLICWFPPNMESIVVALFTGEKASMGDVFYDSVGTRADQIVEQWIREQEGES
ncbi:MAG: hypothetical protein ABI130_09420 [Leifsonia sp.]